MGYYVILLTWLGIGYRLVITGHGLLVSELLRMIAGFCYLLEALCLWMVAAFGSQLQAVTRLESWLGKFFFSVIGQLG